MIHILALFSKIYERFIFPIIEHTLPGIVWKGWNRSLTLFITPLAQRSSVRAWVNEQMDDCMDGLWKREDRVCLKKKVHIRWGSGMQLCSKEQLGWDKRFCPDTGNVHEVAQSSSRELKNGASAFRWDHHVSRIPPDVNLK